MKNLVVAGATGGSGKEIIKQALEKGYEVTAVALYHAGLRKQRPDHLEG